MDIEKNKKPEKQEEEDAWKAALPELDKGPSWHELSYSARTLKLVWVIARIIIFLGFLYLFVCALSFLSSAFRLVGGIQAGRALNNHELLQNPVAALMIGVLVTVLVQSSSTSTSITVALVGSGLLDVGPAIPVIMGANIGTSVTNTIVALGQVQDKNQFRRAFGGATVHDMFNWLSVLVLLPVEVITHYLEKTSSAIVGNITPSEDLEVEILKVITDPFTKWVIQIDKKVITKVAQNATNIGDLRILKLCKGEGGSECDHWFSHTQLSDLAAGLILLFASIGLLLICLVVIVKVLHSLLRGSIAKIVHKVVNYDFPGRFAYFTGYIAIVAGAGCTFLVQSSSIFTSAVTPLVGIGVISLERMYPLTLGANIGTTATGLIAALAVSGPEFRDSLQIAICHLLFNVTGILIWYPIPFIRFPIPMARILGNTTAKYRWFAVLYLILAFGLLPLAVFGLSVANEDGYVLMGVGIPIFLFFAVVIIINIIQRKCSCLENTFLANWDWLPKPLRSLQPYHEVLVATTRPCKKYCKCCKGGESEDQELNDFQVKEGFDNEGYN